MNRTYIAMKNLPPDANVGPCERFVCRYSTYKLDGQLTADVYSRQIT